ncbi:helix-turn-helix domain-containing protein [Ornithinimicrobium flavum]|uniref:helix-turn-helix domain-containing protein n=1 Tax=Ornithinimicrobium flavum TaxID=1288636 RepID=UPI001EE82074|nr:helix-turn-helix transcriptional regulator [Ornithinimicrobium flavum]
MSSYDYSRSPTTLSTNEDKTMAIRTQVEELGRALRARRLSAGLSQEAVCRSAGVARSWLSKVEAGHHGGAEVQKVLDLAAVLGLTVSLIPAEPMDPSRPARPASTPALPPPTPARPPAWSGGDPFDHLFD